MLAFVLVVFGSAAALTMARRAARHPAARLAAEFAVSLFLIARTVFRLARALYRFVAGEVRTWTPSRS